MNSLTSRDSPNCDAEQLVRSLEGSQAAGRIRVGRHRRDKGDAGGGEVPAARSTVGGERFCAWWIEEELLARSMYKSLTDWLVLDVATPKTPRPAGNSTKKNPRTP